MNDAAIVADLREDEGEVLYAYQDHLGFWTIGIGVLIDKRKGGGITPEESAYLLANRVRAKAAEMLKALPWVATLSEPRQEALLNMAFQLGVPGLCGFSRSLGLVQATRYDDAGVELRKSTWYMQTPARAERVIKQLITGVRRHGA